jgi:hypothetical protein
MRVRTIEDFLKSKLFNLKRILRKEHGADSVQLDRAEQFLVGQNETNNNHSGSKLVAYASTLHNQSPDTLRNKAKLLVDFCCVPAEKQEEAIQCVLQYMDCFIAVVQPADPPVG